MTNSIVKGWTILQVLMRFIHKCNFGENSSNIGKTMAMAKTMTVLFAHMFLQLTECVFVALRYSINLLQCKITLKDCVCGEVEITAENYNTYSAELQPDIDRLCGF